MGGASTTDGSTRLLVRVNSFIFFYMYDYVANRVEDSEWIEKLFERSCI